MLGSASRIRRSSVITPRSSSGTLKSTRMRTRLPVTSILSIVCFLIVVWVGVGVVMESPSLLRRETPGD
jgi:hypothetical protein